MHITKFFQRIFIFFQRLVESPHFSKRFSGTCPSIRLCLMVGEFRPHISERLQRLFKVTLNSQYPRPTCSCKLPITKQLTNIKLFQRFIKSRELNQCVSSLAVRPCIRRAYIYCSLRPLKLKRMKMIEFCLLCEPAK